MTVITGFGDSVEPPSVRRRTDTPAGISDLLKDSRFDPAEAGQPPWSARTPSVADVRGYLARDVVYDLVDRFVPAVADLWRAVEAEVEPAVELALRLEELQGAEARVVREHEGRVRVALAAGKTPPQVPKSRDFEAERDALRAELRVRRERIMQARDSYREAARAAMPDALAKVASGLEDRRAKAAAALQAFAPVFNAWRSDVAAADLLARTVDPDDRLVSRTSAHAMETAAAAVRGVHALQELVDSDDPVTSGRRHVEPSDLEVPVHVRRAMWDSERQSDLQALRRLEESEDFKVTAITRGGR